MTTNEQWRSFVFPPADSPSVNHPGANFTPNFRKDESITEYSKVDLPEARQAGTELIINFPGNTHECHTRSVITGFLWQDWQGCRNYKSWLLLVSILQSCSYVYSESQNNYFTISLDMLCPEGKFPFQSSYLLWIYNNATPNQVSSLHTWTSSRFQSWTDLVMLGPLIFRYAFKGFPCIRPTNKQMQNEHITPFSRCNNVGIL